MSIEFMYLASDPSETYPEFVEIDCELIVYNMLKSFFCFYQNNMSLSHFLCTRRRMMEYVCDHPRILYHCNKEMISQTETLKEYVKNDLFGTSILGSIEKYNHMILRTSLLRSCDDLLEITKTIKADSFEKFKDEIKKMFDEENIKKRNPKDFVKKNIRVPCKDTVIIQKGKDKDKMYDSIEADIDYLISNMIYELSINDDFSTSYRIQLSKMFFQYILNHRSVFQLSSREKNEQYFTKTKKRLLLDVERCEKEIRENKEDKNKINLLKLQSELMILNNQILEYIQV
jgi:hypothetical protein